MRRTRQARERIARKFPSTGCHSRPVGSEYCQIQWREIARFLVETHPEIGSWWAQTITVGYERIRGLRDVHQRRGSDYDANKSRTFPVAVEILFEAVANDAPRGTWLPEGWKATRVATPPKSIRADWSDGSRVSFYLTAKGDAKSSVSVQHQGLSDQAAVDTMKAFWQERLDRLGELLRETST